MDRFYWDFCCSVSFRFQILSLIPLMVCILFNFVSKVYYSRFSIAIFFFVFVVDEVVITTRNSHTTVSIRVRTLVITSNLAISTSTSWARLYERYQKNSRKKILRVKGVGGENTNISIGSSIREFYPAVLHSILHFQLVPLHIPWWKHTTLAS